MVPFYINGFKNGLLTDIYQVITNQFSYFSTKMYVTGPQKQFSYFSTKTYVVGTQKNF